ncbi:MAG: NAD-dependent epimerase/dehydratase family protein [Acidimicrobiia bacterium]|nr:NAD-dependent epimerase/dehydratase family protein [Acidimicrobiia bacterium]
MSDVQVVLGGSGGVGHAVATRHTQQVETVRAVNRSGVIDSMPAGVDVVAADAMDRGSITRACEGASVIYHCVHPKDDYSQFPTMTANIIHAAEALEAKLVMAASVYPYGKADGPMTETLPHKPEAPSGTYHARAAELLMEAHDGGRIRATIGRASNYFGAHACRLWPGIDFRAAVEDRKMQIIGKTAPLHTYTYVYDFANGLIALGRHERALGEIWHLPSAETVTTRQFLDMIYAETGTTPNVQVGPKPIIRVMSLFNAGMKPALEVFHQFDRPFVVDHGKYARTFGATPTPHAEATAATVAWVRQELATDAERAAA